MRILDDRGRLLGRVNLIDAAVVMVVCLLIPLAYAGYLLFRTEPAQITAVEPGRAPYGLAEVTIRGENLRPYLQVAIGGYNLQLLFENPVVGVLRLPALEPGAYDFVLYDEQQELQRLPGALVIEARRAERTVSGAFVGLDAEDATTVARTLKTAPHEYAWGQVVGFVPPEEEGAAPSLQPNAQTAANATYQVRAVMRLTCSVELRDCRSGRVLVEQNAELPLTISDRSFTFHIDEVYAPHVASVRVTLRATVWREVTNVVATTINGRKRDFPALDALRPSLLSFTTEDRRPDGYDTLIVVARVPAERTSEGWRYQGELLRIGRTLAFGNRGFEFTGTIVDVQAPEPREAP